MDGSTVAESSRFFHLDGVRDGDAARREMGKGGAAGEGAGEDVQGMDVEVNGRRTGL